MGDGRRSVPGRPEAERAVRRRKRRRQVSERASLIPKSTLSEIFDPDEGESDDEAELIEVEPDEPPTPKRAPWWSVHPVPPPPRRASTSPPPLRRAAAERATDSEVPRLDSIETPLSLAPPPVLQSPVTDAPLVSASEPAREGEGGRWSMRAAAALCVLGVSVVFGFGLGRAPEASSATGVSESEPTGAAQPVARTEPVALAKPIEPAPPAPVRSEESAPSSDAVLSLDADADADSAITPSGASSAQGATVAEAKPTTVSGPAAMPKANGSARTPFDSAIAATVMNEAAQRAASCRSAADPQGAATVVVKFAPSGRVTTSVIEGGPFAGTTAGGCIAVAFRGARVPPFAGEPVTVRKTVTYP